MEKEAPDQPSEQEMKNAEETMTPRQKELTDKREDLFEYEIENECEASEDVISQAKKLLIEDLAKYKNQADLEKAVLRKAGDSIILAVYLKNAKKTAPLTSEELRQDMKDWMGVPIIGFMHPIVVKEEI